MVSSSSDGLVSNARPANANRLYQVGTLRAVKEKWYISLKGGGLYRRDGAAAEITRFNKLRSLGEGNVAFTQ